MIGRMRPFYQTHWDISKDIKHVWLLFCTYYIAWILGDEGRGKMVTTPVPSCGPSAPGVDPPVCCVLAVTYVRGSFCWLLAPGLQFLSGEGRHHGTGLTLVRCPSKVQSVRQQILGIKCTYSNLFFEIILHSLCNSREGLLKLLWLKFGCSINYFVFMKR